MEKEELFKTLQKNKKRRVNGERKVEKVKGRDRRRLKRGREAS